MATMSRALVLYSPQDRIYSPHLLGGGVGKRVEGRVPLEQRRGYQVHPRVGALGGQPGGDEELERVGIGQGTDGVRIALAQRLDGGYCHSFLVINRVLSAVFRTEQAGIRTKLVEFQCSTTAEFCQSGKR